MAFEHQSLVKAKEAVQRLSSRMAHFREANERIIGRGLQTVETVGSTFGWSYANSRWGEAAVGDAHALPEIAIVGVPADLAAGVALLATAFFGGFGKYDEHAFNVGTGSAGAFAARMGMELGSKAAAEEPKKKATTTKGAPPQVTGARGPHGGRVHSVWDERRVA